MKQSDLSITLIIVIAAITMLNVSQFINLKDYGSITISILGAGLIVNYLISKNFNPKLLYLWIFLQIPLIATSSFVFIPTSYPINLSFGVTASSFMFKINIIPLFLFGLYRYASTLALIGTKFEIKELKKNENSILQNFLPNHLIATDTKKFNSDKKNWLKFDLLEPIESGDNKIYCIYIAPKGDEKYSRKKYIPCFIKLGTDNKEYTVKEWVKVKKMK